MRKDLERLVASLALALWVGALHASDGVACASLGPYEKDDAYQRWRDIATNPYIVGDSGTFYDAKTVQVCYATVAERFTGIVEGFALKPFFAYQFKMEGKVPAPLDWPTSYDPVGTPAHWANEQLGYHGRWWRSIYSASGAYLSGKNASDSDYNNMKAVGFVDANRNIHVFSGYLLFDFGITNETGYLYREFLCDSSLHVLWKTSQRTPTANDSAVRTQTVNPRLTTGWYRRPPGTTVVGVYGEWENDRPTPGTLWLPEGTYPVQFRLTEESFHETASYSGSWATVMVTDVTFTIGAPAPIRDAAVVEVVPLRNPVEPGEVVSVDVEVANLGTGGRESISVALACSAGSLWPADAQVVDLDPGAATIVSFVWTAPGSDGNATLTATAALVHAPAEDAEPTNDSKAVTVDVITPVDPAAALVVAGYSLEKRTAGANRFAVATVVVHDAGGQPVAGATVALQWSGDVSGTQSAITGADGKAVLESPKKKNAKTIMGTIIGVSTETVTDWSLGEGVFNPQTVAF